MYKSLLPVAFLALSNIQGIWAQEVNLVTLFPRHKPPILGDICKSLRQACDVKQFPAPIEKLCQQYCEKELDLDNLQAELCRDFKQYVDSLGKCANDFCGVIQKQCSGRGKCAKDSDCEEFEVCQNYVCKPKVCHHYRECSYRVCRDNKCVPCESDSDCDFRPDLKCRKGKCLPNSIPPLNCTKNSDCKPGQVCQDGDCGKCSPGGADCGRDKFCSDGECMPKPPSCGKPGFEWAEWRGPSSWSGVKSPPFAEYDPTMFKSQSPEYEGLTNTLVINAPLQLYGQGANLNLATVIHQGFLLAPETGNYTFVFGQADDIVLVWLGKNAFSGWTRTNADIERTYIPPPGDETRTMRLLEQGTYYPVRVAWGDKGGNVAMSVKIIAPNGDELTGKDGGYFRTEACDGSYDKFPPYGQS